VTLPLSSTRLTLTFQQNQQRKQQTECTAWDPLLVAKEQAALPISVYLSDSSSAAGRTDLASALVVHPPILGFDPYIGDLHASRYGKPALALDLMEEFRPLIVDSVVLSLLNNRQLEPKDFIHELNSYRMTDATKRLFLQKYEDRMQEIITHPVFDYKVSYRHCIELQARLLGKYLTNEIDTYTPFAVR
jgi:CRISPR-associated protein Cas1